MKNSSAYGGLDVSDWILSQEIREYVQTDCKLPVWQKAEIIQGGCRSVEEKRDTLELLLKEAEDDEDRDMIRSLIRMNNWCLEELRRECPGQVFLFMERHYQQIGELSRCSSDGSVAGVFFTYEEFMASLDDVAEEYELAKNPERVDCIAYGEKWAMVDGKMDSVLGMRVYVGGGRLFIQRIWSWDVDHTWEDRLGDISWEAERAFNGTGCSCVDGASAILPFRHGDLLRIDIPDLNEPLYGVLSICRIEQDRFIYLFYLEDRCLRRISMGHPEIGFSSGWRVIDWTHSAQPSELPAGQEVLAELSDHLRRLRETDRRASEDMYLWITRNVPLRRPEDVTLEELLELARKKGEREREEEKARRKKFERNADGKMGTMVP